MKISAIGTVLLLFAVSAVGCSSGSGSETLGLEEGLQPAGYLVVTDISADVASSGSFIVSCAYQAGVKQIKYTQSEIEQNKICPLESGSPSSTGTTPTTEAEGESPDSNVSGSSHRVTLQTHFTYLKSQPNMNITANIDSFTEGTDYCVLSTSLDAVSACVVSAAELQVSGVSLGGCQIKTGYLYSPHASVSPAPSECK